MTNTFFDLSGRIALVTGASSGLGAHFAQTLAAHGAVVALAARRADRLQAQVEEIEKAGGRALALPMDVCDGDGVAAALAQLEQDAGGPAEILVNNAGIVGARGGFLGAEKADTDRVFAVNQSAPWDVARQVARRLVEVKRPGAIVNIASITGLRTVTGAADYAVSKAAVIHMTRIQALELAPHTIRVNAIAPGYFETDLNRNFLKSEAGAVMTGRIPMGRTGRYEELDGPLLLLASDRGSFITGSVLAVDGGHLIAGL